MSGFFEEDKELEKQVFEKESLNKHGKIVPVNVDVLDEVARKRGELSRRVLSTPLPEHEDITQRKTHDTVWTPSKVKKSKKLDEGQAAIAKAVGFIFFIFAMLGLIGWVVYYVLSTYVL